MNKMEMGLVIASIEYPVRGRRGIFQERMIIHDHPKRLLEVNEEETRTIHISEDLLRWDIESAHLGDYAACRLLTPYKALSGGETVSKLAEKYVVRIIKEAINEALADYELGALQMKFKAEYFLFKKLKSRLAIYPPLQRIYWWLDPEAGDRKFLSQVMSLVVRGLEKLCYEGVLSKVNDHYMITVSYATSSIDQQRELPIRIRQLENDIARILRTGHVGLLNPKLLIDEFLDVELRQQSQIDPEEYAYITTSIGEQKLCTHQSFVDILRRVTRSENGKIRTERFGSTFNSTYLVELIVDDNITRRIFVKRYFTWTDAKWFVAKLWAMPLKNFYISPRTRLGNELFFISYLRDRGFKTPEIINVDWSEKMIAESFIEGRSLLDYWTEMYDFDKAKEAAFKCGATLARIHGEHVFLGDCKPEHFIIDSDGEVWLTDLEQASLRGRPEWDLAICLLYIGHYIGTKPSYDYAESLASGYLSQGSQEVLERVMAPKYQLVMSPWTPIWVQTHIIEGVRQVLKS